MEDKDSYFFYRRIFEKRNKEKELKVIWLYHIPYNYHQFFVSPWELKSVVIPSQLHPIPY